MEFLKRIKDRAPEYNSSYEVLINRFTASQGGKAGTSSKTDIWEQGKHFSTKYEIYMYASLLGLKNNYRLPVTGEKKNKFNEIKFWQPVDLVDYIIMGVLAKSDVSFNELEDKDEKEIEIQITALKRLLEEYANGGLDKIRSKFEDEPHFFNNDNCFIDLLDK